MATRTHVTIHAKIGTTENEARTAIGGLVKGRPFGPVELWRSSDEGQPMTFFVALEGDVKDEVSAKLRSATDLPFTVEVMEVWDDPED